MPLFENLTEQDRQHPWSWATVPGGVYFVVRQCAINDPGWVGFRLRGVNLKSVGVCFAEEEAERLVLGHNAKLKADKLSRLPDYQLLELANECPGRTSPT